MSGLPRAVRAGVLAFNLGRYQRAHETWERVWPDAPTDDRGFLEALVQLAAGVHLRTRRGGTRGAEHLLAQALATLEDYRPSRHGVDVDTLVVEFQGYFEWVRAVGRPHRLGDGLRVPRIRRL